MHFTLRVDCSHAVFVGTVSISRPTHQASLPTEPCMSAVSCISMVWLSLQKLQHAHQVLQQKLDTDGRLHRQALATAAKERQQLEQQVGFGDSTAAVTAFQARAYMVSMHVRGAQQYASVRLKHNVPKANCQASSLPYPSPVTVLRPYQQHDTTAQQHPLCMC